MIAATDTDTAYGRVLDLAARAGWPSEFGERALRNAFFDRWVGYEVDPIPVEGNLIGECQTARTQRVSRSVWMFRS
jgi:nitronate monooxygenase